MLEATIRSLDGGSATVMDMVHIARAIILVCDTLPTYNMSDTSEWVRATELRRLAAAIADSGQIGSSVLVDKWLAVRLS